MTKEIIKKIIRSFTGTVVSAKMAKTIVVKVDRVKIHPTYHKRYVVSKKFKVHDAKGLAKVGDNVVIRECRPLSKDKHFLLVKINSAKN